MVILERFKWRVDCEAETRVILKWIADISSIWGSWTHVSNRLYDARQSNDSNQDSTRIGVNGEGPFSHIGFSHLSASYGAELPSSYILTA